MVRVSFVFFLSMCVGVSQVAVCVQRQEADLTKNLDLAVIARGIRSESALKHAKLYSECHESHCQSLAGGGVLATWFAVDDQCKHHLVACVAQRTDEGFRIGSPFVHTFEQPAKIVPGTRGSYVLAQSGKTFLRLFEHDGKIGSQIAHITHDVLGLATNAIASHILAYDYAKWRLLLRELTTKKTYDWRFPVHGIYSKHFALSDDARFVVHVASVSDNTSQRIVAFDVERGTEKLFDTQNGVQFSEDSLVVAGDCADVHRTEVGVLASVRSGGSSSVILSRYNAGSGKLVAHHDVIHSQNLSAQPLLSFTAFPRAYHIFIPQKNGGSICRLYLLPWGVQPRVLPVNVRSSMLSVGEFDASADGALCKSGDKIRVFQNGEVIPSVEKSKMTKPSDLRAQSGVSVEFTYSVEKRSNDDAGRGSKKIKSDR